MTTLKEETIKGILAEGAFDMSNFGDDQEIKRANRGKKKFCGTACCVAGHIVAAAARLGRKIPTTAELVQAQEYYYASGTRQYPSPFITKPEVGTEDSTALAARVVWARAYGKESASKLDFYAQDEEMATHNTYLSDLEDVPASAAVAHLERVGKKGTSDG